jgi:hypothetical protein
MSSRWFFTAIAFALWVGSTGTARTQETAPTASTVGSENAQALEEVTVTAQREVDPRVVDHVLVPRFVRSHAIPSPKTDQVARWYDGVCPSTLGLQPLSNEFVSRRVIALARSVGAPTASKESCKTNVEIMFTANPSEQLDYVAKNEPVLLGMPSPARGEPSSLDHPIQAWYVTQTRSYSVTESPPWNATPQGHEFKDNPQYQTLWQVPSTAAASPQMGSGGVQIDSSDSFIRGVAGSYLSTGVVSEFANVLVIVDSNQVRGYSLNAIAEYVAMLVLTRASLNGCNELPSVIDLLSRDCGARPRTEKFTDADTAYLTALYASNLEKKLAIEQGEMHDRMLTLVAGH